MAEAVPTPTPPPTLATLSTDLVVSVLQFLDAKDTARTCLVSHAFYHLVQGHDEVLFRPHVLRQRLVSNPTPLTPEQNLAAAHTLQKALAPPGGWKGLYVTKHLLGVPCLGYFRRVPRDFATDFRGSLLRLRPAFEGECDLDVGSNLRPTAGVGLILEALTPSGTNRGEMNTVFVRLCEQLRTGGGIVLRGRYGGEHTLETEVHWSAHKAISDHEDDVAASQARSEDGLIPCFDMVLRLDGVEDGETTFMQRSFYALPSEPPSLLLPENDRDILEGLRGFWVGTYGSHGKEIIQVRFTTTTTTTTSSSSITAAIAAPEAPAVAAPAAPPVIMEGLKITGDANVPANEWSFRAETGPLDKAQALGADTRPVYTLDTHMGPMPRLLSQEARRIHSIYRGKGQINMVPGIWAPQEVGVDVVVLYPEENEGKGGLWVVWHDVEYTSRHCIDLTRLVETEAGEENEGLEEEEEDMEG